MKYACEILVIQDAQMLFKNYGAHAKSVAKDYTKMNIIIPTMVVINIALKIAPKKANGIREKEWEEEYYDWREE